MGLASAARREEAKYDRVKATATPRSPYVRTGLAYAPTKRFIPATGSGLRSRKRASTDAPRQAAGNHVVTSAAPVCSQPIHAIPDELGHPVGLTYGRIGGWQRPYVPVVDHRRTQDEILQRTVLTTDQHPEQPDGKDGAKAARTRAPSGWSRRPLLLTTRKPMTWLPYVRPLPIQLTAR